MEAEKLRDIFPTPFFGCTGFELSTLNLASPLQLEPHIQPFCSGYFEDRVLFFAQAGLDYDAPLESFPLPLI
jgi:hypothetical protein